MSEGNVLTATRADALWITINRPDARNSVNPQVLSELLDAVRGADASEARAIVITGAGDRAFCAGGDLGGGAQGSFVEQHLARSALSELVIEMRQHRLPVIGAVNGHALGGGFGLALACDLVVAVESAQFGTPEINLGLWPYVISALIQRALPDKVALEMMMRGTRIGAEEARRWGFVNRVVAADELGAAVDELVADIASKSPLILRLGKQSFYGAHDLGFASALRYLESQLTIGLQAEDVAEGISAFFAKRDPEWKGR